MSGIVGIVNLNGSPVDGDLLASLTGSLAFRGPDRQAVWHDGNVGFGHTLLATTDEAWNEEQPCTLDGNVWMTADARLDGRGDLSRRLAAHGRTGLAAANDAELLLHAYHVWGEECVHHIIGDFAFAVWDTRNRRLFCARDHFGVRPFAYAHCGGALIFSNTVECIRRHPAVSDGLDELTIADFLLFRYNMRPEATGFADIRRLPGGHALTWSPGSTTKVQRYWTFVSPAEVRYRRSAEYVEHFNDVFGSAVRDRLRTPRIVVSMSGGLDSTTVAAAATRVAIGDSKPLELRAQSIVYDRLFPDEERKYTSLAGDTLGVPIDFFAADDYEPYVSHLSEDEFGFPGPIDKPYLRLWTDANEAAMAHSRVVLRGDDGDALLNEVTTWRFAGLIRARRYGTLAREMSDYATWLHRCPPIALRTTLRHWTGRGRPTRPTLPAWLNPDFAARLGLEERQQDIERDTRKVDRPLRPRALLTMPGWHRLFESWDASMTRRSVECRWPFMDRRVVDYLLSIPAVPWCTDKMLLRVAGAGILPESVRWRPKAPLAGDPVIAFLQDPKASWLDMFQPRAPFERFVDRKAVPRVAGATSSKDVYLNLRPWVLNRWLESVAKHRDNLVNHSDDLKGAVYVERNQTR